MRFVTRSLAICHYPIAHLGSVHHSAVQVLGDATLTMIARELVKTLRKNVTIDWTAKDSVKAQLRIDVKRILRKYHYPPDKQVQATQTILEQEELLCADWADEGAP